MISLWVFESLPVPPLCFYTFILDVYIMTTLKIFVYKGVVGATTDVENGTFLNDLSTPGNMGAVVLTQHVVMTQEAKDLILQARREGGSFAPLMLTRHSKDAVTNPGEASVGVLGLGHHLISDYPESKHVLIGRDCSLEILDEITVEEFDAPQGFKDFVDSFAVQTFGA